MTHFDMVQIPKLIAFTTYYSVIYFVSSVGWKEKTCWHFIHLHNTLDANQKAS